MVQLGTGAIPFSLPDPRTGSEISLEAAAGEKATVIMFICNHCPFVKLIQEGLVQVAEEYRHKGVGFVAINSNDVENYPDDAPEKMVEVAKALGYPFPYLYDETQEVAKAYDAACTPDIFVYDAGLKLAYRGQFDDARPGNGKEVTGESLRSALDDLVEGRPVQGEQKPSIGCNIKWKQ
jgi:thiol-disulfide isomerase/thioredoxin